MTLTRRGTCWGPGCKSDGPNREATFGLVRDGRVSLWQCNECSTRTAVAIRHSNDPEHYAPGRSSAKLYDEALARVAQEGKLWLLESMRLTILGKLLGKGRDAIDLDIQGVIGNG